MTTGIRMDLRSGVQSLIGKEDEYLLYIPGMDGEELPTTLTVSENALVYVKGDSYWAWHKEDPMRRVCGGEIVNASKGQRAYIADLIRNSLSPEDPRWAKELPEPFFNHTPLKLVDLNE